MSGRSTPIAGARLDAPIRHNSRTGSAITGDIWEAPHPWRPWTRFQSWDWPTEGFYNPSIPPAFIGADGTSLWAFTTGDFRTAAEPPDRTKYTLYLIRATLHSGA